MLTAEKLCSEMTLEAKLNFNKYIHFPITSMKEIWVHERLLFELFIVTVNDKKYTIEYTIYIKLFKALNVEVVLVIIQIVINV